MVVAVISVLCHYLEEGYSTTGNCLNQKQHVYMYLETRAIFSNQRIGIGCYA